MSQRAPVRMSPLSVGLWLIFSVVVAVAGTVLLERSQVGGPVAAAGWSLALLVAEIICYLVVLTVAVSSAVGASRAFVGTLLGLVIRAGICVITTQVAAPVQASDAGYLGQFSYFYLSYWPGALVQICAVAIFLWVLRDMWGTSGRDVFCAPGQTEADAEAWENRFERQRELLAALMEPSTEEGSGVVEERVLADSAEAPASAGFYEDIDSSESLTLPLEESESESPEAFGDMAAAVAEGADDTSLIPVVAEEPEELEPVATVEPEPVGEQILPGQAASGITAFAGGVLVWGAQRGLDESELAATVAPLLAGAEALAQAAAAGAVQLLLIEAAEGCWGFAPDPNREHWWVGLAQPGADAGRAAVAVRKTVATIDEVELPGKTTFPGRFPAAELQSPQEAVSHALADPVLEQWRLTMTLGEIGDQRVLTVAPAGRDRTGLASSGLQVWQGACQVAEVADPGEASTVLVGGRESVAGVSMASWQGDPALLAATGRDIIQVAGIKLLLAKLIGKLRDYGPRYRPSPNAAREEPMQ